MPRKSYAKPTKRTYKKKYSNKVKTSTKKTLNPYLKRAIKAEISKNIENKLTLSATGTGSILTVDVVADGFGGFTPNYTYAVYNPFTDGNILNMMQGTANNQRIGNQIKIKRWVLKGTVYLDPNATDFGTTSAFGQAQGYIDVYFGRRLDMSQPVAVTLDELYQDGSASVTPEGLLVERLYAINRDKYKIYWHRRFKVGESGTIGNNDYKLNREFGFDICKYVCKNKIIKYDDAVTQPSDALVQSLSFFATITQPNLDVVPVTTEASTSYSPVRMQVNSYIEYEDA